MLAEKLLLNLLITIAPVLVCNAFTDKKERLESPLFCGLILSVASLICMAFSYANYSFHWDFRYVPLILAFLYSGRAAGFMVLMFLILARILMGGETVLFGILNCILTALPPLLLSQKFHTFSPNKRVLVATLTVIWSLFLCYLSLTIFHYIKWESFEIHFNIPDLFLVGAIETLAILLSAKLFEGLIERKKLQEEIRRAEKLNTLGELAASIAHEVRNPLTVVKGFLQLMKQQEKGKNFEYLDLVLNELGRAESIINDYLNFAKPKFEKIEEFPLEELLMEVITLLDPLAVKQGVQLESKIDTSQTTLITDRNQLKQAMVNLIKNAIEATPDGGKVAIHTNSSHNHISIEIKDTGKGMTKEQLSRIGTLFYTTKDKGTGLGTSVSLRIIETMNGKVSYQSKLGEGTKVTVVLPIGNHRQHDGKYNKDKENTLVTG